MAEFIWVQSEEIVKGTYVLILSLDKVTQIEIGKLGTFLFKSGFYTYVGSAFGNGGLRNRLAHHLNISKKLPH